MREVENYHGVQLPVDDRTSKCKIHLTYILLVDRLPHPHLTSKLIYGSSRSMLENYQKFRDNLLSPYKAEKDIWCKSICVSRVSQPIKI